ncbi:sigma-70 family RNA polymerase sigma factor [Kerstersia sp.]|uniref:sigma-70 family RNA polymerase sigma factor n=1 Tax=Kerstersia sp. TaxID=1930783 RepID=UPI003F8FDD0F
MLAAQNIYQDDLASLYAEHLAWLQALLHRRLGNAPDACDLAQDVFLILLRRQLRFDDAEGARAYMSRMAKNLCTDLWRRRAVEQAWVEAMASRPEPLAPSPEERAIILETICGIAAMLARLPEKAASAFVLAHLEGMAYRDIAARLGVSERMVKKYIAQAMLHCALVGWPD